MLPDLMLEIAPDLAKLTIAVVAVTPLGVVQLGSLDVVFEDLNLVTHIKDIFCSLQSASMRFHPIPIQHTMKTTISLELNGAWSEAERKETAASVEPLEGMGISQSPSDCGSNHLLEAVVASALVLTVFKMNLHSVNHWSQL
ncbi:hypothetical protein NE237_012884 [Protea cynaroides]|uniref:Transcription factor MYC/MYB N-terminal domain-containing protein n=1 Tax=Protea cynaroides TaxID=273540 RepID=A0A9Q0JY19_9MAGN|nr:hypothetical protein NE237_012884 [Protea cynaroides]